MAQHSTHFVPATGSESTYEEQPQAGIQENCAALNEKWGAQVPQPQLGSSFQSPPQNAGATISDVNAGALSAGSDPILCLLNEFANERIQPASQYAGFAPAEQFGVEQITRPQPEFDAQVTNSTTTKISANTASDHVVTDGSDDNEYFDLGNIDFGDVDPGVNYSHEEIDDFLNLPMNEVAGFGTSAAFVTNDVIPTANEALPKSVAHDRNEVSTQTPQTLGLLSEPSAAQTSEHGYTFANDGEVSEEQNLLDISENDSSNRFEPSEAVDSVLLHFDTEDKYLAYKRSQKNVNPHDPTLPTTWAQMMSHVLRLKKAMIDVSKSEDSKGDSFKKRWSKALPELFYSDQGIEDICWEIVFKTVDLHKYGIGILNCHDPEHLKKYKSALDLSFEERMDKMVEYALKSKARVDTLMKHDTLDTFVAIPHKLITASKANHTFNGERMKDIKVGRVARKAGATTASVGASASVAAVSSTAATLGESQNTQADVVHDQKATSSTARRACRGSSSTQFSQQQPLPLQKVQPGAARTGPNSGLSEKAKGKRPIETAAELMPPVNRQKTAQSQQSCQAAGATSGDPRAPTEEQSFRYVASISSSSHDRASGYASPMACSSMAGFAGPSSSPKRKRSQDDATEALSHTKRCQTGGTQPLPPRAP
ncbi:hypothetical protein SVAN01_08898 [Stagonosporopsis vannaccii]|nr:hypothetical protein SVAN01_08898 [Stagonosporopsis vannaccii]